MSTSIASDSRGFWYTVTRCGIEHLLVHVTVTLSPSSMPSAGVREISDASQSVVAHSSGYETQMHTMHGNDLPGFPVLQENFLTSHWLNSLVNSVRQRLNVVLYIRIIAY